MEIPSKEQPYDPRKDAIMQRVAFFMPSAMAQLGLEAAGRLTQQLDKTSAALAAAKEVLNTHKGLSGDALTAYLDTYFAKAWAHFDVNQGGDIEVIKMPQFMRFLCSDQNLSLGESG